mmetsp:Transcript_15719/g.29656  ORF Transcript_15719/g.29656 Transcript_15719/m.29656 type:complete len:2127 (-) Transcript_15719:145-6525(-)
MEVLLRSIEKSRLQDNDALEIQSNEPSQITLACSEFILALHNVAASITNLEKQTQSIQEPVEQTKYDENQESRQYQSTALWLYNLMCTIPSPLDCLSLSISVLLACQNGNEMSIQSELFDILGEGERSMEVLFEIMSRASDIARNVDESQLRNIHEGNFQTEEGMTLSNVQDVDPELEYLASLRQNAMEVVEFLSLLREETRDSTRNGSSAATHTVKRTSEKATAKLLKKATKDAAKAMEAARKAGAILDDEFEASGYDMSTLLLESESQSRLGLHQMGNDEFKDFQASLMPAGTKEYHLLKSLPRGTIREQHEDYEMVTIPATIRDPSQLCERIVLHDVMTSVERKAFSGTSSLNPMQSTVFKAAFHTNDNLLICAPTGAGKTNVAMLAVVAHLRDKGIIKNTNDPYASYQHIGEDQVASRIGRKIVYIAPMKALAQEVVEKFSSKLKSLNVVVRELTGDMQLSRVEAERADILVTTPEKWDVVTRKGGDGSLAQTCGLLIIDEVHLLADDRGAVIESVVARLHRFVESSQTLVRIVGLSATLPNYKDVATFLRVDHQRGLFYFGPEHRPVPLQQQFIGILDTKNRFRLEKKMNQVCYDIVSDSLKRGHQVMVFVHSRKGTSETVEELIDLAQKKNELEKYFITKGSEENGDAFSRFSGRVEKSRNRELVTFYQNGLGIHHAGMLRGDRKLTEQMFSEGAIKVLCCTATLAWGINLPVHTVVIKGTEVYNPEKGGAVDLSILDVMQIFGRAGRPQFDSSGEAALISTVDGMARYLDKLVREVPIESTFIKYLADHLNAEVVGGTVSNILEAAEWLMYTYLHVRMIKNPIAYGINASESESDPLLRKRSLELVKDAAKLLDNYKMIRYDPESGNLAVTDLGRVASHFYIQSESIARFNELLEHRISPSDTDLMDVICHASEFENVRIRPEEMDEIDKMLKNTCPLGVKTPVEEYQGKCCVLMQAFISGSRVNSFTLTSDTNYIASNAGRVSRALFEMCLKRGLAGAALKFLRIAKSVDKQLWWFHTPLRQFESEFPSEIFRALNSRIRNTGTEYNAFDFTMSLLDMHPNEVGELCHKAKLGSKIQQFVRFLPNVDVTCDVQPVSKSILRFQVAVTPTFSWSPRWHGSVQGFWLWVEDSSNNRIYHQEYIQFNRKSHPEPMHLEIIIPAFDSAPSQYFLRVVSDAWVGSEVLFPVTCEQLMYPSESMTYTELMDLTPLPVCALNDKRFEQLYKFPTFNPIQTQLFHVLFHTNSPVLVGAPTGSGKTIIAELALLRMKKVNPKAKCVYIAPLKSLARERLKEWKLRLGKEPLKWQVLELSGDTHHDRKSLQEADVLVCTPEKWDLVSRGWRGRNGSVRSKDFVKDVRLLILDEIHLLGEERGAILEAIVSRTRFISRLLKVNDEANSNDGYYDTIRIVGLSTAISNASDLADWIGIDTSKKSFDGNAIGLYNFRPSVRPIPMEVHIAEFDGRHYCPRMATMNKPCYSAIKEHSPTKPVIIFVASRRQTRLTALDLINYAAGDENPGAFLGCSDQYISEIAETINDASLRHTITYGIGLHHAGLSSIDRELVETMFLNGDIQVLVATATLAWGVNLPAHFVIVKGTEFFDGKSSRYVDYPVTDVLQMIGRAGRPQFDTKGVALVMVKAGKKNFYKRFLYHPFPVESCLMSRLTAILNAEIAIGTVTKVEDCVGYLDWTFLARRCRVNPSFYGAKSSDDDDIDNFLMNVVMRCVEDLCECRSVIFDESSLALSTTYLGIAASEQYLCPQTPFQMENGLKKISNIIKTLHENSVPGRDRDSNQGTDILRHASHLEEIVVAWILYVLSWTKEFSEFPVRHNEEHLNAELSKSLPWGPKAPLLKERGIVSIDDYEEMIFAEPHTKCYLLIQAYLSRSKLPITDYINDTSSVLDQLPRLLSAMEFVTTESLTCENKFDLICMLASTRQLLNSRMMPEHNPFFQFSSISESDVKMLSKKRITLREVAESSKTRLIELGLRKGTIAEILTTPFFAIESTSLSFQVDKVSHKCEGRLEFNLIIKKHDGYHKKGTVVSESSFVIALGTSLHDILLARQSVTVKFTGQKKLEGKKHIALTFDWALANSCGGADSGNVILRVLSTEIRGMDIECSVPLLK